MVMRTSSITVGCTQGECRNRIKRVYAQDSPFWEEGNLEREALAKKLAIEVESLTSSSTETSIGLQFTCQIVGCNKSFTSTLAYEGHYNTAHKYSCNTCGRMFPGARLLELHILETHDSLFSLLATRQNMYECLVETCKLKFARAKDREKHLIDLHHYPKAIVKHFQGARCPRKVRRKKKKKEEATEEMIDAAAGLLAEMDVEKSTTNGETNNEAEPMNPFTAQLMGSRTYAGKVPDAITFGRRGRGRGTNQNQAHHDRRGRGGKPPSRRERGHHGRGAPTNQKTRQREQEHGGAGSAPT